MVDTTLRLKISQIGRSSLKSIISIPVIPKITGVI